MVTIFLNCLNKMENADILRTEGLFKKYHNRTVVNDVSIQVKQGEIVGLLGPNGAGKTTSFYMIVGLIKPLAGKIFINDKEITHLPMYKRARIGIGYLAQEASVFRQLSVEDNLKAVLQFTKLSRNEQKKIRKFIGRVWVAANKKKQRDTIVGR